MRPRVGVKQGQWGHVNAWGCKNGMGVLLCAGSRLILAIWVHPRMAVLACCVLLEPVIMSLAKEDHEMHRKGKLIIPGHHQAIMGSLVAAVGRSPAARRRALAGAIFTLTCSTHRAREGPAYATTGR